MDPIGPGNALSVVLPHPLHVCGRRERSTNRMALTNRLTELSDCARVSGEKDNGNERAETVKGGERVSSGAKFNWPLNCWRVLNLKWLMQEAG